MSTDQSQSLHTAASNSISRHPSAVTKSVAIDTVLNFSCCFFFFFYKLQGKRDFSRFGHLILNISLLKHFDYSIQSLIPTHLVPLEDSETHQVFFFLKHVTHKKSLAEF